MKNWVKATIAVLLPPVIWLLFIFGLLYFLPVKIANIVIILSILMLGILAVTEYHSALSKPTVKVDPYGLFKYYLDQSNTAKEQHVRDFYFDMAMKAKSLCEIRCGKKMIVPVVQGKK